MIAAHSPGEVGDLDVFFVNFLSHIRTENEDLSRFFAQFDAAYRDARSVRAATTPHLDVLRVFGLQFAELRHSSVLAWFLEPEAGHEQGPLFANALLVHLGLEPIADENYTVFRERHQHVDLGLYAPGRFAVFLENKVRHHEREKQLSDLVDSMSEVSRLHEIPGARRFAVFLTDKGDHAATGPTADTTDFLRKNLRSIKRIELFQLFRSALDTQHVRSPLLTNLLDSYLNAIRRVRAEIS